MDMCEGLNTQQKEAVTIQNNVVVAAGAGSGKTKVLSSRFVYLIAEKNYTVDQILALTFTDKAAAEMHSRIYGMLKAVYDAADNVVQKKRIHNALQDFHQAQIMTLDAFCNKIAKTASRHFGISPDFSIDMYESCRLAYNLSLDFFLEHRTDEVLQYFLGNHSIQDFVEQFFVKLLTDFVTVTRPLDFDAMFIRQKNSVYESLHELKGLYAALAGELEAFFPSHDAYIGNIEKIYRTMPDFFEIQSSADFIDFLHRLDSLIKVPKKTATRSDEVKACKETIGRLKALYPRMCNICNMYYHLDHIKKIYQLYAVLQERYIAEKKQRSVLHFADVACLAVDALITDIDLRGFYKNRISRIMIDEFQDNNSLHRDLLFLLAEKPEQNNMSVPNAADLVADKLFFVGDEKQSIYAFRGADVSVFRNLADELQQNNATGTERGSIPSCLLNLATNYRTEPALISFFNTLFSYVLYSDAHQPEAGDSVPAYEAVFTPINHRAASVGVMPQVEMLFVDKNRFRIEKEKCLTARETEAYCLAKRIRELYDDHTPVSDGTDVPVRPCRWSDFAVLLRTGNNQAAYERFFRMFNIPYRSVQQKGLFYDAPLNDLYALLRLTVYPRDTFTYAQVIRSPFVHISDMSFAALMLSNSPPFDRSVANLVVAEDKPCFLNACALFERLTGYAQVMPNAELVTALWYDEGYRAFLLQKIEYHRYLELYDYLFALAVQADAAGLSLSNFVDRLAQYVKAKEKIGDIDIPIEYGADAVKIMTVHKSKGLEFPIVCIPDCGNGGKPTKKDGFLFFDTDQGVLIHLPQISELAVEQRNPVFESLREQANAKLIAECKRLFYVAMTRAKVHIIVSGVVASAETAEGIPEEPRSAAALIASNTVKEGSSQVSFFQLLCTALSKIVGSTADESLACLPLKVSGVLPVPIDRLHHGKSPCKQADTASFSQAYAALPLKQFPAAAPPVIPATQVEKDRKWTFITEQPDGIAGVSDDISRAAVFGTLVHKAIESRFKQLPFIAPKKELAHITALCNSFFNSDLGKKADAAQFRKTEYGFLCQYDGQTVAGQIDLLFEYAGTLFVVDYKTDAQEHPAQHTTQLRIYKKAVEYLCIQKSFRTDIPQPVVVKAYIFYLRTGHAVEVV